MPISMLTCPDKPIPLHLLCHLSGLAVAESTLVKMKHVSVSYSKAYQGPGCSVFIKKAVLFFSRKSFVVDLDMRQPL